MSIAPSSSTILSEALPPGSNPVQLPELLAPAGDWECARAAVENGADAIYFGLEKFNARMRANNFTEADLPELMEFLHRRGVKGYVTFNTLVFETELVEAEQYLRSIVTAGADAAIVQDIGICRLIRKLSPDFPIHASTQMTITSAAGVEFARELDCSLVVLARECSLKEIGKIRAAISASPQPSTCGRQFPLEVFVHGALCVAYSGQCLTSEALGGRSANRGECAQACRMPYELIADGRPVALGDRRYLLSPQDLAGLEVLPDLIRVGVASLKIEGRLKTPEYVANITRVYRRAIDEYGAGHGTRGLAPDAEATAANPKFEIRNSKYDMEMAFSRGLHTGWFRGINNQQLVHARFGKKRGVYLGEVSRVHGDRVVLALEAPLKPGDGVVFDSGHPDEREEGGRVYEIRNAGRGARNAPLVELGFGSGDLDFARIRLGDKLWKTSDPELDRCLRQTFQGGQPRFQRSISVEVHGRAGRPLTAIFRDEVGHVVRVQSAVMLTKAERQPLSGDRLTAQLGRLGGTPFKLGKLMNQLEGDVMLPVSELNRLRREAVEHLDALRTEPKRWTLHPDPIVAASFSLRRRAHEGNRGPVASVVSLASQAEACDYSGASRMDGRRNNSQDVELIVLVRSVAQLEAAVRCGVRTLYCEFADPKKYREAVTIFRTEHKHPYPPASNQQPATSIRHAASPPQIFVAPPRIFKTGEEWILEQVRSCDADGYLMRNYDHLKFFSNWRRIGDFPLNVANSLAADCFINLHNLERVTASYDLNVAQLEALLQSAPPDWFEITIHQHMPMFHMEHCVFCAFLSTGTDYTNCGRPCDRHVVGLKDRVGAEHPLTADAGCRNTVFNALAQSGAEHVERMIDLGVRWFRVEFLKETPEQVGQTIAMYRRLLRGEIHGTQLWRELKLLNQLGVTRGPMV